MLGLLLASSLSELSLAVLDQEITQSIQITLFAGLIATVLCSLAGIPLAYLLARKDFVGKNN